MSISLELHINLWYTLTMRMHRKAHLEERLLACGGMLTVCDLLDKNMSRAATIKEYLPLDKIFPSIQPLHIEVGCGKGGFVCALAKSRPDINFIAVEKISNVLIEAAERAISENIKNVHFLNCAAEVLPKYVKEGAAEVIYLNFSNPLPKLGYAKQRLTHPRFLNEFRALLKDNGKIIQKTDDFAFYEFSLASYKECGYKIISLCEDLAALCDKENIVTEHEKRFMEEGKKIYRIVAEV